MTRPSDLRGETVVFPSSAGLLWTAETGEAERVRDRIASRIADLETDPGTETLKKNLVRTVLRTSFGDGRRVIVKRYRVAGLTDAVKYAVRRSRARTEWDVGRALTAAGIPTAVPIAFAERHVRGVLRDAALVTREIEGALHLNAWVEAHVPGADEPDAARRRALYDALAALVRRMHVAGFVHNDFHGGNLLVNGPPDAPRLHVIDLHSVSGPGPTSEGARWFDLRKLLHSMLTCSTADERRRICEIYAGSAADGTRVETRATALLAQGRLSAVLEPELLRMEERRVRSRTDRSLARSTKFDVGVADGFRVHHLRGLAPESFTGLLDAHRRDVAAGARSVLKDGRRSALTRQTLPATSSAPARSVIVKEYRGDGPVDRVKNLLRMPRAVAAWVAGNGLRVRGFDAAEPLALLLRGRGLTLREAFIVMEDLGDGTRADLVALQRWAGALDGPGRAEKQAAVAAAAEFVRRLHAAGVYHGDLKAVNLFLRGEPAAGRYVLADYDRVEFGTRVGKRRRVKNLAQLSASVPVCVSLADRRRFFRVYAGGDAALESGWKPWFRAVTEACRRKIVVRDRPIE